MRRIPQRVDIPGFEGIYYVTIDGKVYHYGREDKPLKPVLRRDGYAVCLCGKNGKKHMRMNNIMRMCYFNNTNLPLKHLASPKDFSYWNLKPTERKEISKIAGDHNRKAVVRIYKGEVEFYASATECGKENDLSQSTVGKYCSGKRKTTLDGAVYMWESCYFNKCGEEYDIN